LPAAFAVGGIGHLLDEGGGDLVTELLLDRLAAVVVGEGCLPPRRHVSRRSPVQAFPPGERRKFAAML
jgi:hypothetical protein